MKSILLFACSFLLVISTVGKDNDPFITVFNHSVDSVKGCRGYFTTPYCSSLPMRGEYPLGISDSVDWYLNEQMIARTYGIDTFYAVAPGTYSAIVYWTNWVHAASCYAEISLSFKAPCPAPTAGFFASSISSTDAIVNWNSLPCSAGYKVEYRIHGTSTWFKKNISSNTGSKKLTNLSPNTTYDWKVRTKCSTGPNVFSVYSAKQTFITASVKIGSEDHTESPGRFLVYPNPATDFIMIDLPGDKISHVKITDEMGKVVQEQNVSNNSQSMVISSLPSGIYFITISCDDQIRTGLFTKK